MTKKEIEMMEKIISCMNIVSEKEKELSEAQTTLRCLFAEWEELHVIDKDLYL